MIRVASYNIRKAIGTDRRRRPERTIDVLNELGADVVALQEADRRFGSRASAIPVQLLEQHSDYKPVPFDTREGSIGWHGNALLVRKPVEILERHLFHLPSLEPRGAVLADVKVNGSVLRIVGHASRSVGALAPATGPRHPQSPGRARRRPVNRLDGRSQRMERSRRLPSRLRRPSPFRAVRTKFPCPPADRDARPDHGHPRSRDRLERRPCKRHCATRFRSSSDLGGAPSSRLSDPQEP